MKIGTLVGCLLEFPNPRSVEKLRIKQAFAPERKIVTKIMTRGLAVFGIISLLTGCSTVSKEPIVARVGSETITLQEYKKALDSAVSSDGGQHFKTEEGTKQVLENIIRGKLIIAAAREEGIASRPDVAKSVSRMKEEMDNAFKIQVGEILGGQYIKEAMISADKEADDYYSRYKTDFDNAVQIKVRHILFESEPVAVVALERLRAGTNFQALARQISKDVATASRGGEMDYFGRAQCKLGLNFEEAAFALQEVGEVSKVIKSDQGYHIITLIERKQSDPVRHEETMYRIRSAIKMAKYDSIVATLAKRIKPEIFQEVLSKATVETGPSVQTFGKAASEIKE